MTEASNNLGIDPVELRLSVQRALLGVVGVQVLGICIMVDQNNNECVQ